MQSEFTVLEQLIPAMRPSLAQYAELVRSMFDEQAKSLTLFGAIITNEFERTRHTVRSVLVLDRIDLTRLVRLADRGLKLAKSRIAAPLTMTPAYIQASRDAFPLELLEIQQQHVTLFGDDPFAALTFEETHVRLQCERELKTIALGMRQALLAAADHEKSVTALQMAFADGLLRTLRGLLWLKGDRESTPTDTMMSAVEKMVDRPLGGVRCALDPGAAHGWHGFESLYGDVEALGQFANAW